MAWLETHHIPFKSTPYEFHLYALSDLQLGSENTALSAIKSQIQEIIDDPCDSGIVIPGDIEDEDRPSTRTLRKQTFAGREEVIHRDAQKHMRWIDDEVIPLLLKLQKTKYGIMGVLAGHHWTQLSPALNSVQYICQELTRLSGKRVPYVGEMMSYIDLRFETSTDKTIKKLGLMVHGEGAGQTKSATIQKIEKLARGFEGDFFIRGHDCQLLATKNPKLYPQETKNQRNEPFMLSKTIAYLNTGAYTQGYSMGLGSPSYIEQNLLLPATMGSGYLRFLLRHAYKWEDPNSSVKCNIRVDI